MRPERESRPEANRAAEISAATTSKIEFILPVEGEVERCTRCGHVITAAVSLARGTGPVCATKIVVEKVISIDEVVA